MSHRTTRFTLGRGLLVLRSVIGLLFARQPRKAGDKRATVLIDRPPAEVWRIVTDVHLLPRWFDGRAVVEPLDDLGFAVGARSRVAFDMESILEITAIDAPVRYECVLRTEADRASGFEERVCYHLAGRHGRTELTVTAHTAFRGWLLQRLEPLLTALGQHKLAASVARLAELAEGEPSVGA